MSSEGHRRTLAGRYRLEEVVGRGGMSTVYRATDLSLDREVAVKVAMDPLLERDPVYAARFKREARAAAALNQPGVVTVFDAGADGPTRYIVMEYVAGRDLSHILRDREPDHRLEPAHAANIAAQVADSLAAAHAAGIVHRDIKPGHIMVAGGASPERVKVLDFGIAHTADVVTLTQTASVLGTAPYMSPEQAMGQPADARSDIYSLGCVLYEMLTGKPPFMAEVPAGVLHQHVRVAPKSPREINPLVPPALDALVLQMLAKSPEDRPQTAAEVRDRLANFETETAPTRPLPAAEAVTAATAAAAAAAEVPQMATVPQAAAAPPPIPPDPTGPPDPTAPTRALPPRRSRATGPWAFLAVVALLLLGAAVAYALASGGSSTSASSQAHSSAPARSNSTPSHASSTPTGTSTSSSTSTPSTSTTTASTTTTTVTTTTTTPPATSGGAPPTPPGQGGAPPGHAKKGKKK